MNRPAPPSSSFVITLDDLLYEYQEAIGVMKYVVMQKIRQYVRTTDYNIVVDEIKRIDKPEYLNYLLAVGMKGGLWHATVARIAFLKGYT